MNGRMPENADARQLHPHQLKTYKMTLADSISDFKQFEAFRYYGDFSPEDPKILMQAGNKFPGDELAEAEDRGPAGACTRSVDGIS